MQGIEKMKQEGLPIGEPALDSTELLTPERLRVEVRTELVCVCFRPDRNTSQILDQVKELEQYIFSGES